MFWRFAGRLVTGPLAFFVAGAIDVGLMLVLYARWRAAQRAQRTQPRGWGATPPS